jgi:lipopolysaccharide transport system permease protein
VDWSEVWRFRELLFFLAWRDIKVRYKQTILGGVWAILQPLLTIAVFSFVFGRLAGLEQKTGAVPYPIHVYTGVLLWTFFAGTVGRSGASLIGSAYLITKVYFPRLIVPLAAVGVGLVDLGVSSVLLLALMLCYGLGVSWQLALLPLFLLGTVLAATGVGTLLASLTVSYRDLGVVIPFALQLWMFLTPVVYPASLVPARWEWLLWVNPMAGLIEGFRASLLGLPVNAGPAGLSLAIGALLFLGGAAYCSAVERRFADII